MKGESSLVERVRERVSETQSSTSKAEALSKEALEALELSERYGFIEPEPYILPLDALAGFASRSEDEEVAEAGDDASARRVW